MGNEVSRSNSLSPQNSGAVSCRSPYTPTGNGSRHASSFTTCSPPPLAAKDPPSTPRRTSSSSNLGSDPNPLLNLTPTSRPNLNPKKDRTIQRMDKAIRSRVRGGITYNMKLLLRGAKGTGKTSLFHRLKGESILETYQSTPQLQTATINWKFRENLEEKVKCEVWDVVDRGFVALEVVNGGEEGVTRSENAATAAAVHNGTHSVAIVDASTVNVYHEAHGVIFLLDITKWDTLEYVKQQLDNVPVHIPTLVLGNFRDQGAQRKIFKEDIQEMLYGSSNRPQSQQWRRPTELLYFECSLLNCYGLKSLHKYFGIPFLQLKLATITQQMRIVEGEFTHLKHDVQATITEQRYAEYVEYIKMTGSDIRTGRRSSGSGSTSPAVSCNNSATSSFNDVGQAKPAHDDADNVSKENGAGTPLVALTTQTSQADHKVTELQNMKDLPARKISSVIEATPSFKFQHKESMSSIPEDATDVNVSRNEGEHIPPSGNNSESPLLGDASPNRPRKALTEKMIHLEDFQVPKTGTSDLDHFYLEDETEENIGGNDEDVVVTPADGSMKANTSGAYHKQLFLDSDSSDSDESESMGFRRRRNDKASYRSAPHRRATKLVVGQTILRPHESSHFSLSLHSPPTAPLSMQKSRPGSPMRSKPSSPIKTSQIVPREELPKQRHSFEPTSDVALTSTHPAVLRTSASASLARQSSLRSKSENSSAATNPETRVSEMQGEKSRLKNKSFSSEEPELTGTENPTSPCGQESLQGSLKRESPKSVSCETYSSTNGANNNAHISTTTSHATENKEMNASVAPVQDVLDNGINSGLVHTHKHLSIRKEIREGSADAGTNELCVDEPNNLLAHDGKEEYNHSTAATSQEIEDADMPHELVASRSPQYHPHVRMNDEESVRSTSDLTGPTKMLKESVPLPELSAPSESVTSQGVEDTVGHYHKRNMYEAGDFHSLSALQASLPLPGEAALPLPSILHKSTQAPIDASDRVSDFKTNATPQLSDHQTIPSKASVLKLVVPRFTTVVPSNDLEAFLNEIDSDLENVSPSSDAGIAGGTNEVTKLQRINRSIMVDSSDDSDEEGGQDRFASYSTSKKSRSEWRRQQKEDMFQLNAALNMEDGPLIPSASAAAATDSSFVTSGVMEAIRKAEEDAMRMLLTDPALTIVRADSSLTKKRHTHKQKKHKNKMRRAKKD